MELLLAAIFLPLFPISIVFNTIFKHVPNHILRASLLLGWPIVGVYLHGDQQPLPGWVLVWALATAVLYGFRLLTVRDMGLWIGFLATSAWALLWIAIDAGINTRTLYHSVLGFSFPFAMLAILARHIETRFGAAYTNLYGGLATTTPRLGGLLVFALLAATATPVFPAFFIMLHIMVNTTSGIIMTMLVTWLLWSWASACLLKGLLVGDIVDEQIQDIGATTAWIYGLLLAIFAISGIAITGDLL